MEPARDATADETERALDAERDRSALLVAKVRVFIGGVAVLLHTFLATVMRRPDSREILLPAYVYALSALALYVGVRARPAVRSASWFGMPLLDLPIALFIGFRFVPLADSPVGAANVMIAVLMVCLGVAQLSLRATNVGATFVAASVVAVLLQFRAGGPTVIPGSVVAVSVLAAMAAVLTFLTRRASVMVSRALRSEHQIRALNAVLSQRLEQNELQRREVEVLNVELRRQIELRSEQLSSVLSRLGSLAGAGHKLRDGALVGGRYRVLHRLGSGAMGEVFEVLRASDGARLAMKVLQAARTGEDLARLAREAQAATRLAHPNVVRVHDIDVEPGVGLFVVMELVAGGSLEEHRARFGDGAWARPLLVQIAQGLAALHRSGVVHRDLKPGNVLLDGDGTAKIVDLGIALVDAAPTPSRLDAARPSTTSPAPTALALAPIDRPAPPAALADTIVAADGLAATQSAHQALGATLELPDPTCATALASDPPRAAEPAPFGTGSRMTRAGAFIGTPLYMAPELAGGALEGGPPADIFAFGIVACELLTGRYPFAQPPLLDALGGKPMAPPELSGIDLPLRSLLARCLAPTRSLRPSAEEVASAMASAGAALT